MRLKLILAAVMVTLTCQLSFAGEGGMCLPTGQGQNQTQGHETWPWGMEVPFPWRGIQGLWMANINGCSTYFTFKIVKNVVDEKILQIHEINPVTCTLIAKGAGYEDDRVVMAVMNGKNGAYNMEVHSFRESDVAEANERGYTSSMSNKVVTMMTVSSVRASDQKGTYQLYKVSSNPDSACKHH
jgi:hypothetical protein